MVRQRHVESKFLTLSVCITILSTACSSARARPEVDISTVLTSFNCRDLGFHKTEIFDASAVFLSEDKLALLISCEPNSQCSPEVLFFSLTNDTLVLERQAPIDNFGEVFAMSRGRVVVRSNNANTILASDPAEDIRLTPRRFIEPAGRSSRLGYQDAKKSWHIVSVDALSRQTAQGVGELTLVSDEAVVYVSNRSLLLQTPGQKAELLIGHSDAIATSHPVQLVGKHFLLFPTGRIVDFSGRNVARIKMPLGWGERIGSNTEGSRILFDRFVNNSSHLNLFNMLASVIVPVPEHANLETIRVTDSKTGETCLSLNSSSELFGVEGHYHSDLSPSGSLVVLANKADLSIFRIAQACRGN